MPPTRKKASRKYRVKAAWAPERRARSAFPFLQLPAELRNHIYEYVLTAPHGVKMIWEQGRSRRHKKPTACIRSTSAVSDVPINQLRFVNKQLRRETAGLEIQYNTVHFESIPMRKMGHPIVNLRRFCGSVAPSRLDWLTHVVIDGFWYREAPAPTFDEFIDWICDPFSGRQIERLLRQAKYRPQLRIDLRVPTFELTDDMDDFLWTGFQLSRMMRGIEKVTIGGEQVPLHDMVEDLNQLMREGEVDKVRRRAQAVPNLRFFPHNMASGKARLEELLRDAPTEEPDDPLTATSKDMLEYVQRWFSGGI